jgi:hypothetical protein
VAYATYVVNAAQFFYKLRVARREAAATGGGKPSGTIAESAERWVTTP